ncbi:unnamed protein product [Rotaria magnacalcarata]|uniref:RETREG1-3/ARL6IP-like N-terminal reticulon-homology domain-containing protein n=1 Tax=Rotaria magnacalcarata TaxID=392030 RepID=A0A816SE60_9BILA|nr:unnamed protein product [Rotaria magnacalcarata]CAF1673721.1 unnamed protein product [Rotaria magnacalcarata]CAF2085344.1 unnamed protein product [Rotaria magnacalcarata]CAF2121719.1 unnamed protein product [Rotaria magnacalcarata]CAF2127103.1 unnamed protein product [Rotaria magnacalcarata]
MSSRTSDSSVTSTFTMKKSSLQSDDLRDRTEELKQSLVIWRNILLPLNKLLEWENKYDPFIIFGIITFIFIFILQANPPVLTLVSCVILAFVLIDLLVPIGIRMLFKNEHWTSVKDAKYTRLCERIANFEQHIKQLCESALKMRKERPLMYLMLGAILLSFIAFCGQRVDNLLLSYLTTLLICLIPGIRNRQLIPFIRQQIVDFWNNKKSTTSPIQNVSILNITPSISSVKASTVVRSSSNQPTYTLYSTTSHGNNKTKAQ